MRSAFAIATALVAACSSTQSSTFTDASAPEAAATPRCPETLEAYCRDHAGSAPCNAPPDFASATAACGAPRAGSPAIGSLSSCGDYDRADASGGIDVVTRYYFDHGTGALVAVVQGGVGNDACVAGPASFVAPTCAAPRACAAGDAGSDAP